MERDSRPLDDLTSPTIWDGSRAEPTKATPRRAEHALLRYIETSHQPKLSSRGWSTGRAGAGAECLVGVVGLAGDQAVVELAEHAVEQLA